MTRCLPIAFTTILVFTLTGAAQGLPFKKKIETFRNKEGDVIVFALHLEQPFLAEEFETSNYLRLQPLAKSAYLIYPKETKFRQKHAAFYGRLRGKGRVKLRLSYEVVTENLDGSRRVEVRKSEVEVSIPQEEAGHVNTYRAWARHQNAHFRELLSFYPRETFFQYCLLQSKDRYGISASNPQSAPTHLPQQARDVEADLYRVFTGSLAIQEALQKQAYSGQKTRGDHNIHISQLKPPELQSLPYPKLLEEAAKKNLEPKVHEISKLVPADQYLLHFNSIDTAWKLSDLTESWGDNLLRLFTIHARHNRIQKKIENQLCLKRDPITQLFAGGVIGEVAVTGSDVFIFEGTDLTVIFRLKNAAEFEKSAAGWVKEVKQKHPEMIEREFNYRGHKLTARYTEDRLVSSFLLKHEDFVVYSNSHVSIRKMVDTIVGKSPPLIEAEDYRYVSTILPPSDEGASGYFFASEAFLRRQVGPERKISEKRRIQCFNNLVMLNNASMFYRLESGRSPASLTDLVKGRFVDPAKLVCPHGGAYAFDAEHDAGTCSLHNRLKYLTPNTELKVLKVSSSERQGYNNYKRRYQEFWQGVFDPIAIRMTAGDARVKIETCVLPFANGSVYSSLQEMLDKTPQPHDTSKIAESALVSLGLTMGQKGISKFLKEIPGIPDTLAANPTLTDLSWIGDRLSLHLCDEDTILEVDPTRLRTLNVLGRIPVTTQSLAGIAVLSVNLPTYLTIEVHNREKARQFLEQLSSKIFLKGDGFMDLPTSFDAYRLPDYRGHANYVLSYQIYALKIRLHAALVGNQLVAATRSKTLYEVIDAADAKPGEKPGPVHMMLRFNLGALNTLKDDLQLYWAEKSRLACHANIMSIYNLLKLYEVPVEQLARLSEAKYGVTYYCPEGGAYSFEQGRDQVQCSVHGNRQSSKQNLGMNPESSFAQFFDTLKQVSADLRFREDSLITTVVIDRERKQ